MPPRHKTYFVAIGNSDDKLSQHDWAEFGRSVSALVQAQASRVYFACFSEASSEYQNASWNFDLAPHQVERVQDLLRQLAAVYRQDSIAWTEGVTILLEASPAQEA